MQPAVRHRGNGPVSCVAGTLADPSTSVLLAMLLIGLLFETIGLVSCRSSKEQVIVNREIGNEKRLAAPGQHLYL